MAVVMLTESHPNEDDGVNLRGDSTLWNRLATGCSVKKHFASGILPTSVPTGVVVHIHPNLSRISGCKIDMGLFEKRVPMGIPETHGFSDLPGPVYQGCRKQPRYNGGK